MAEQDEYKPDTDFDVNISKVGHKWNMGNFHYHNSYEIYYLSDGGRRMLVGEKVYELSAGDIVLIRPNVFHRSMGEVAHERYNIEFTREFIWDYFSYKHSDALLKCFGTEFIRLDDDEKKIFKELFLTLKAEHSANNLFFVTFADILKHLGAAAERQRRGNFCGEDTLSKKSRHIGNAVAYINANYQTVSSVDEIAAACFIDKSYLCRLFKKETGMTLFYYLSHARVEKACAMLTDGDMPITEIALNCGFSSSSYFSSVFKKIIGTTPLKFRSEKSRAYSIMPDSK
ncbi:MAG: AraC family transcriptional regulator [Firmicutes bacterium]|nr:AraC family transcriptional regulator [Bacillota bacterium]